MRRWFLSNHSKDQILVKRLKAAAERKAPASSVFFALLSVPAGGAWTAQLAGKIAEANEFIRRADLIEFRRRALAARRPAFFFKVGIDIVWRCDRSA
jgi:hypothetical protein